MCSEAETFMILKYGSIPKAYNAWLGLTYQEQVESFKTAEYEILMEYEYEMHTNGPGPFEPR